MTAYRAGYSTQLVRSGVRSLRRGIYGTPDNYSYSSGYQDVLIPARASGGTLSFWCYPSQRDLVPSSTRTSPAQSDQVGDHAGADLRHDLSYTDGPTAPGIDYFYMPHD